MRTPLYEDECVIKEATCRRQYLLATVAGEAYLTTRRIIYETTALWERPELVSIDLDEIVEIRRELTFFFGVPAGFNSITLTKMTGGRLTLFFWDATAWFDAVTKQRANAVQNSASNFHASVEFVPDVELCTKFQVAPEVAVHRFNEILRSKGQFTFAELQSIEIHGLDGRRVELLQVGSFLITFAACKN